MDDQGAGSGPALPPRLDLRKSGILKAKLPDAIPAPPVAVSNPAPVIRMPVPAMPRPAVAPVISNPAPASPILRPIQGAAVPAAPAIPLAGGPRIAMPAPIQSAAAPAAQSPARSVPAVPAAGGPRIGMPTPMMPHASQPVPAVAQTVTAPGIPVAPGFTQKPAGVLTAQRPGIGIGVRAPGVLSARPPLGGPAGSPTGGPLKLTRPALRVETPPPAEENAPQPVGAVTPVSAPAADPGKTAMINIMPAPEAPVPQAKPAAPSVKPPAEQSTIKLVRKPIPGISRPIPSVAPSPSGIAAKKQTSKISMDQAIPTPNNLTPVSLTAPDAPAEAKEPVSPLIKKATLNMAAVTDALSQPQGQDALLNDKRKTSRISLEAVLAAETSEVKKGPSAPSTIKLKRPTDSAGVKIGLPKSPAAPGATVSLSQTAKLDEVADDASTATKKKTIKIRKPGAPSEGGAPAAAGSSGAISGGRPQSAPAVYKESTGSKTFSVISIVLTSAAMIVISVTIYMFTSQVTGQNACLTETSYNPIGSNLGWGTKITPVR